MATDAPVTFNDLPDDMLHEIFGHVFAEKEIAVVKPKDPPQGTHLALRSVCRRWLPVADWARLTDAYVSVEASKLANVDAARLRYPAAIKRLEVEGPTELNASTKAVVHFTGVPRATASLIRLNPDLRRSMSSLLITLCCAPSLVQAVPPIATCSAQTSLVIGFFGHKRERTDPSNILAPLSALPLLQQLTLQDCGKSTYIPTATALVAWFALPDAPRLTRLELLGAVTFVPIVSDAALGRLRALQLVQTAAPPEAVAMEDPFFLRAALDKGTWKPHRLTALRELGVTVQNKDALPSSFRLPCSRSPVGAEWVPLAAQVTKLEVHVDVPLMQEPSTGIVAGLGALTALRLLELLAPPGICAKAGHGPAPLALDRVRAPHLTNLNTEWTTTPLNLAAFPSLVDVNVWSCGPLQAPIILRSLVARPHVRKLELVNTSDTNPFMNLAQFFAGGAGLLALYHLHLYNLCLEWDTTGLADTPTAAEFATRARELLPSPVKVDIDEARGRNPPIKSSRLFFLLLCRRHVVPALQALVPGARAGLQATGPPAPPPPDPHRDAGNAAYRLGW